MSSEFEYQVINVDIPKFKKQLKAMGGEEVHKPMLYKRYAFGLCSN